MVTANGEVRRLVLSRARAVFTGLPFKVTSAASTMIYLGTSHTSRASMYCDKGATTDQNSSRTVPGRFVFSNFRCRVRETKAWHDISGGVASLPSATGWPAQGSARRCQVGQICRIQHRSNSCIPFAQRLTGKKRSHVTFIICLGMGYQTWVGQ